MRVVAAALAAVALGSGCGLFTLKEPYERWHVRVSYVEEDDRVVSSPGSLEVHGPRGEILVTNSTEQTRGFKIDGLGVAAEIEENESARLQITGAQDGETYRFGDHLNGRGPRGTLVVRYVRQDR